MTKAINANQFAPNRPGTSIFRSRSMFSLSLALIATLLVPVDSAVAGEKEMLRLVAKKAAILSKMHKKSKKALVNSAQDTAFNTYFQAENDTNRELARGEIQKLTLNVQKNFHVEEMCLINRTGLELVRIVGNAVAPDEDLSAEEASAIFFEAGFATRRRRVSVSPLYMSPDVKKWVLAYTTPIAVEGKKPAILHYERGLGIFQNALNKDVSGSNRYVIAVTGDGFVISDSREEIALEQKGGIDDKAAYFGRLDDALARVLKNNQGLQGSITITSGGKSRAVAFAPLEGGLTLMAVEVMQVNLRRYNIETWAGST